MVGVPGRSKGCRTCRKRKKGCDLQQPTCGQCKDRGIPCGGYDNDRVFIYQDSGTKCQTAIASPPLPPSDAGAVSNLMVVPDRSHRRRLNSPGAPHIPSFAVSASLFRTAFGEKSIEAFLNIYVPQGNPHSVNSEGKEFLELIPVLTVRDEALRLATLAIGTVALGRETSDVALYQQGRKIYSRALIETRKALLDPTRARSTAILAIPRVLAIYEILFAVDPSSSNQAHNWLSHAEGEVALIVARGPESFIDEDQHRLFANARYRPLIASVRTRTACVLNDEVWKTVPWRGRIKTPNDTLLDILAAVPEVLERVDKYGILSSGDPSDEARDLETVAMCWNLHFQLEEWLAANGDEIFTTLTDMPTPIMEFPNLDIACLTIRYWVTALLLYSTLDTASGIPTTDDSTSYPDRPHPRKFARWIGRSGFYFFRAEFGITGATALSFPLGNALLYFQRNRALDFQYMKLVFAAWSNPKLPNAIKLFLESMRSSVKLRDKVLPAREDLVR